MPQRIALMVNPTAGKGRAAKSAAAAVEVLRAARVSVEVLIGRDVAEAQQLALDAVARGTDALVALGGDGMVHLAVQAVATTTTPLGIIAAGTGNDLATCLGLPVGDVAAAARCVADLLVRGVSTPTDAVRAGARWWACVLGSGFDSKVNDRANRLRWPRGRARYNLAILAELRVFRPLPFTVTYDGERVSTEAMLVAVGNAQSYGAGMRVLPDARVDDGLLDVMVLGPVSKPEFLKVFPKVYKGTHTTHPAVTIRRAREVTISSPGVSAYADGEYLADLPVTNVCVPGALRVLRPAAADPRDSTSRRADLGP
ncbi:MAG TPA: diacylglycerol kinase [Mycobacteriales bacterium]|nr:diacylglycerol kinase [Mycobacteriales bacterium]